MEKSLTIAGCRANDWSKVASGGATVESVLKRPYFFVDNHVKNVQFFCGNPPLLMVYFGYD